MAGGRFTFGLRRLFLFVAMAALATWGCDRTRRYIFLPRVSDREVQRTLEATLKVGMPIREVSDWLASKKVSYREYRDATGRAEFAIFIANTGPRFFLCLIPDDIIVRVRFDQDDRLVQYSAVTEPRF